MSLLSNFESKRREIIIVINRVGKIIDCTVNTKERLGINYQDLLNKSIDDLMVVNIESIVSSVEFNKVLELKNSFDIRQFSVKKIFNKDKIVLSIIEKDDIVNGYCHSCEVHKLTELVDDIIYIVRVGETIDVKLMNAATTLNTGYTSKEIEDNPHEFLERIYPRDFDEIKECFKNEELMVQKLRIRHKNGEYIWFENHMKKIYFDHGAKVIEGILKNIQNIEDIHAKLRFISYHDGLTNLYNRSYFEKMVERLNSLSIPVGLMVCDMDNLKISNDENGHFYGDELLKDMATFLKDSLDDQACICRIGGDEFVIIYENIDEMYFLSQVNILNKEDLHFSVGYHYYESSYNMMEMLFSIADKKMYEMKKKRKMNFRI